MKSHALLSLICLFVTASAFAEFRAGAAMRIVTPDKLLHVSGGTGPSIPSTHGARQT